VLWSLYFNVDNTSRQDLTSAVDNVIVISGPDELMDYDHAIAEVTHQFLSSAADADADAESLLLLSLPICQCSLSCTAVLSFNAFCCF